jgi:hypothetical protein
LLEKWHTLLLSNEFSGLVMYFSYKALILHTKQMALDGRRKKWQHVRVASEPPLAGFFVGRVLDTRKLGRYARRA